ncbi:uroporphyrinogen-III synthase [Paracoccus onubensis]|uniref:uroporphyrinogen-III synthase n=1 Tax=Paracoccus onubensis TaxID=1675788 RepID=UPI0027302ADA|nr:uroporphyrinogen-III synthase [Paracoccus onubensis]MDP0930121.1 uroporphyrinogen-III synthase [Paracoccus onubensis]
MTAGLLLTRPEADSRRFAAMLPEFRAVISPILRIEPVAHDASRLRAARGLVFTSAHAVASAGPGRGRLALCVGGRTAQVARAAGFMTREGNGFADSLLPLIESAEMPLIHPHGRHLARELPVEGMVVYDQIAQPLNADARALLTCEAPVLLPLFSPRSARLLAAQTGESCAELWIVAISPAAAVAWSGPCSRQITAAGPTADAMAAAIRLMAGMEQS